MNLNPIPRTQLRIPVLIPASIYRFDRPREGVEGEIRNISLGGAFVLCQVAMQINQQLIIEIRFGEGKLVPVRVVDLGEKPPTAPYLVSTQSQVKWAQQNSADGFGVEFAGLDADARVYLQKLVNYFERLALAGVEF